jgi:spore germination protein
MAAFMFFAAGCWDKVEIEDRGMVTSIGIDASVGIDGSIGSNTSDRYRVTVSMPGIMKTDINPLSDEAKTVITSQGESLDDALKMVNNEIIRKVYLGQAKSVVLGKDILTSPEMLKETIESLEKNRDVSRKIFVLACETSEAREALSLNLDGMPVLGVLSENYYTNNPDCAKGARTLEDMIACLYNGDEMKIAAIEVKVNDKEKNSGEIIFGEAAEVTKTADSAE